MGVLHDPDLERLLTRLHAESDDQTDAIRDHYDERDRAVDRSPDAQAALSKAFLSDKLYALDRDKAEFCYQLCRATDARRIVEIGTSYGVSTLYLAAAVRDNVRAAGGEGVVIGTEYEPEKAHAARAHFREAGLTRFIDLREGDLRETLAEVDLFFPNEVEVRAITGTDAVPDALRRLAGGRTRTIAKLGAQGCATLADDGRVLQVPSYSVEAVDTTGAGDSFNAGFLHAWLARRPLEECLRWGAACGSLSTRGLGGIARQASAEEAERRLRSPA